MLSIFTLYWSFLSVVLWIIGVLVFFTSLLIGFCITGSFTTGFIVSVTGVFIVFVIVGFGIVGIIGLVFLILIFLFAFLKFVEKSFITSFIFFKTEAFVSGSIVSNL